MNIEVKKIELPALPTQAGDKVFSNTNYLNLVSTVEVECQIRIGTLNLTIGELSELRQGQTLTLQQTTDEPIELILNNQVIARGELVCVDNYFAMQITEVFYD